MYLNHIFFIIQKLKSKLFIAVSLSFFFSRNIVAIIALPRKDLAMFFPCFQESLADVSW